MDAVNPMAPWREAFDAFMNNDSAAAMGPKSRHAAFERFEAHGLPTKRHEYWKYTPVKALSPDGEAAAHASGDLFAGVDAYRLVFVDGRLDETRSDRAALAGKVDVAGEDGAPWMDGLFAALQARDVPGAKFQVERPLADLNMAMFTDGLAVRIPAGVALDKPIHLRYEGEAPSHLRLELLLEEGASATILESGSGALTTGAEIIVADKASLHHLRAQTETAGQQFTALYADVGAEAQLHSFTLASDAALLRNETMVTLSGDDAVGNIAAGVLGRNDSLIDNTVYVSHEAERGESRQVVKNVLDDAAQAVFQGKIYVRQNAQKTDGYQISQSVLLDERAQFNAKPELEIYADDVACSHGSTTGSIDEDQLFYLRARGCSKREAESLLVAAFVDEAIEEIEQEELQDIMRGAVSDWMTKRGT